MNCRTHEHRHFERTLRSSDTVPGPRLAEGRLSNKKKHVFLIQTARRFENTSIDAVRAHRGTNACACAHESDEYTAKRARAKCVCCSGRKSARTRAMIATRRFRVSPRVCACVCGVAAIVCVLERERVRVDIKYMCYFRTARTLNVRLRRSTTIFRLARNDGESSRAAWPRALRERRVRLSAATFSQRVARMC